MNDEESKKRVKKRWVDSTVLARLDPRNSRIIVTNTPGLTERTPGWWAQRLVDHVATVTQLDPEKGELANVEDWRRNAEKLFKLAVDQGGRSR